MTPRDGLAVALAAVFTAACTPAPRMCTGGADCDGRAACVAGRCVASGAVPAISTARRMLYDPVEVGFARRGGGNDGGVPPVVSLGGRDRVAFLRFSVPLQPETTVLEAYLLLERAPGVDSGEVPVALHVARVVDPWDARSLSWAAQPRVEEVGAPVTRLLPAAGALARFDVRAIVERWRRRSKDELGIALVGEGGGDGVAFALSPRAAPDALGPRLELYVR